MGSGAETRASRRAVRAGGSAAIRRGRQDNAVGGGAAIRLRGRLVITLTLPAK